MLFAVLWQMGSDGALSAEEQMFILYEIKLQCHQNLSSRELETTGKSMTDKTFCLLLLFDYSYNNNHTVERLVHLEQLNV